MQYMYRKRSLNGTKEVYMDSFPDLFPPFKTWKPLRVNKWVQNIVIFLWSCKFYWQTKDVDVSWQKVCYLWIWDLGGFLCQTAALCRDQIIVFSADVLIWIMQTAWTGTRRWPKPKTAHDTIFILAQENIVCISDFITVWIIYITLLQ